MADNDLDKRIDRLRQAANMAAQNVQRISLIFLLVFLYVSVSVFSTTHEQLLRGSGAVLPLFEVQLPLVQLSLALPGVILMAVVFRFTVLPFQMPPGWAQPAIFHSYAHRSISIGTPQ